MLTVLFFSLHQEHSQNETSSRSSALSRFCDLLRGGCCKGGRSDRVQKKVSIGARPPASAQYRSWSCGAPAPASGRDQRDWIPCGNCTAPKRPHALSGNIPPPKKNLGAGKDYRPSNLFGLAPALQTCANRLSSSLRSFQMDEMGTEPSQAGREAFGRTPRTGGSCRRAVAHTDPGREGGSTSVASQVNSNPFWARVLARGRGKFQDSPVSGC